VRGNTGLVPKPGGQVYHGTLYVSDDNSDGAAIIDAAYYPVAGIICAPAVRDQQCRETSCQGYPTGNGRTCSTIGYFANVKAFLDNNPQWRILSYN
jgi:hypothetical protein